LLAADAQTYAKCRWRMQQLDCKSDPAQLTGFYGCFAPIPRKIEGKTAKPRFGSRIGRAGTDSGQLQIPVTNAI